MLPKSPAQSTTVGRLAGSRPKIPQASDDQSPASRSSSSEREAVAASVTNDPVSSRTSQASIVVTTAPGCWRASQVSLGAEK